MSSIVKLILKHNMTFPLDVNSAHHHMKESENPNSKDILFYPTFNRSIIIFLSQLWTSHGTNVSFNTSERYHPNQVFPSTQRVIESYPVEKT